MGEIRFTCGPVAFIVDSMSETAISASEAAKDFLGLLARVERERQPAILLREGKPVATLSPVPGVATDY